MTSGTAEGLGAKVRPIDITLITAGAPFRVDSWLIEPYSVPHDTRDPVAFVIERDGLRTGTISDLGRSTRLVERQLASMDVALVEFNHDIDMLMDGSYPWSLKQRVSGDQGHLSNAQAAELLNRGASERLSHVLLGHISEENNTPELVLDSAETAIRHSAFPTIRIELANQKAPTLVEVKRTPKQPATINAETNEGQQLLFT
jgi:phosphoribosyl 1,2-cyclic phosphodiesterase